MTPTTVLFDADGVLQRQGLSWHGDLANLIGTDDPDLVERFLADVSAVEVRTLTGELDLAQALPPVLARWGVDATIGEVLALWRNIDVNAQMIAAVRSLGQQGIRCALGTNQHAQRAAYMREELDYGAIFDPMFYSCEVGLAKPNPAFFEHAVAELGEEPGMVLFMDDQARNVEGAREAGLPAELFARDGGVAELSRILGQHGLPQPRV
jgi:HAD superfamily hydrolase (TIGR01509 family)